MIKDIPHTPSRDSDNEIQIPHIPQVHSKRKSTCPLKGTPGTNGLKKTYIHIREGSKYVFSVYNEKLILSLLSI